MSNDDYHTCGMHLLGSPDVVISESLLQLATRESDSEIEAVVFLLHSFCLYILTECGDRGFVQGHTFSPDEEWPRLKVVWEECQDYDEDDLFFNPFGRWRFTQMV